MSEFKKMWDETGKELDNAFMSLGKSIVKSAKLGIRKLDEWANSDSNSQAPGTPDKNGNGAENEAPSDPKE